MPTVTLFHGDSLELLNSKTGLRAEDGRLLRADASVTDPPYGFDFAGEKEWDTFEATGIDGKFAYGADDAKKFEEFTRKWSYGLRANVLKPGSYVMAFTALRTIGPVHYGLLEGGYEIPRVMMWLYAQGQVKNKEDLRPGGEPIFCGRVPSDKPYKALFKETGRGQMHAQECKIPDETGHPIHPNDVVIDESLVEGYEEVRKMVEEYQGTFFVSKPSAKERDLYCGDLPLVKKDNRLSHMTSNYTGKVVKDVMAQNFHPTVKSIELMRRLIKLVSRPGHTIIDPFMGSGTTGVAAMLEGRNFIGIERDPEYFKICETRIRAAQQEVAA